MKQKYEQLYSSKENLPDEWEDENIILLKDSVAFTLKKTGKKLVATEVRDEWYYINKRIPNDLEKIYVFYADCCHEHPIGKITAYYKNGKSWSSSSFEIRTFKDIKSYWIEFRDFGAKYIEIKVPNYSEGMVLHKRLQYTYSMPEVLHFESVRGNYNTLKKIITFSIPNNAEIRYGISNKEKILLDTTQLQDKKTKTFIIESDLLDKKDKKIMLKEPEEWYAGLHFSIPHNKFTSFSWNELGDHYLSMISESMTSSLEIKELADLIKSKNPDSIIYKAFDMVQERVRYLADEEGIYGFVPRSASQIFKQGYGDCKEKSNLMKMILKEKNIDVNLALVMATEGNTQLLKDYPNLGAFNHMIFYHEKNDGTINYYDPTIWFSSAKKSCYRDIGQKVFLLDSNNSRIDKIRENTSAGYIVNTHSEITKSKNKWVIKGVITLTELAAWRNYYNLHWYKGEAYRPKIIEILKAKFNISPTNFEIIKDTYDTIQINYESDFQSNFLNMDNGGFLINKPAIYNSNKLPPDEFPGPRYYQSAHQKDEWVLPKSFIKHEGINLSHSFGKGVWQIDGNILRRSIHINNIDVSPDEKENAITFNEELGKFSKSTVWK
jgi:hypothetical protein